MIFVIGIIIAGSCYAAFGAFEGLLFYMWNAYFRPDYWTYGPFIMSSTCPSSSIYVVIGRDVHTRLVRPEPCDLAVLPGLHAR